MKGALHPRIIEQERVYMNTTINIKVLSDESREKIEKGLDEAFSKFKYVVDKFTRFEPTSELSKLNSAGGPFKVSEELFDLVKFSLKIAEETGGAFDPTIIDLLEAYGYKKGYDFSVLENREKLQKEIDQIAKTRPSFMDIKLNDENNSVVLAKKQRIDLGGVGKGYAIDLAAKVLLPFKNFIINAGGDIYVSGTNKDKKLWNAGLLFIDEKGQTKLIGKVDMKDQALASSGSWARKVKYFHHLLNPRTGKPHNEILQTFVIAKRAIDADAYSTALFVSGQDGIEVLEAKGIDGMFIDSEHNIHTTKGFNYEKV